MTKKRTFIIVGIVILVLSGAILLKSFTNKTSATHFQLAPITKGSIESTVSSTGTLSAIGTVNVGSQVSGIIEKIYVDYNDRVKKGQLLAVLDKSLFRVSVNDAEAQLMRVQAKYAQAKAEVNRNRPLFEKGHLSEMEFLVTTTTAETAAADVKSAEAALSRAKTQLEYSEIRSPINGTIIERSIDEGQTIAASFQAPQLFVIAEDLTRMQIEAAVDESDIGQIKENQSVRFTVQAYIDQEFTGTVRQIRLQPTTVQNVVNYTVVVDAFNENGLLLPGMTATVDFIVEEKKDVLVVSNSALYFKPTTDMKGFSTKKSATLQEDMGRVFCIDDTGFPRQVIFAKGATDGMKTEVLPGGELKEGMNVITGIRKDKAGESSSPAFTLPRPPGGGPH